MVKGVVIMTLLREFLGEESGSVIEDWPIVLAILGLFLVGVVSIQSSSDVWSGNRGTVIHLDFWPDRNQLPQIGPLHR